MGSSQLRTIAYKEGGRGVWFSRFLCVRTMWITPKLIACNLTKIIFFTYIFQEFWSDILVTMFSNFRKYYFKEQHECLLLNIHYDTLNGSLHWMKNVHICGALRHLEPFVQFKKREKHPWVFFTFLKLCTWYQIAQRTIYASKNWKICNGNYYTIGAISQNWPIDNEFT